MRQCDVVYTEKDRFICDCERTPFDKRPAPPAAQDKANAQAIAALPDLLAALETSLSIIEDIPYPGNYAADSIRSALIKAGYTF